MGRILLLLLVTVIALAWAFGRRRGGAWPGDMRQGSRRPGGAQPPQAMVRCARCGLHLPASEALQDGQGDRFCSEPHRQQGPAR